MSKKLILVKNDQKFIDDLTSVRDVLVFAQTTRDFLRVTKKEVMSLAEKEKIHYYLTDEMFVVQRTVMVIL